MNFSKSEPTENFPIIHFVSETGQYEAGLVPMLFGVRVRAGKVGDCGTFIDYCAGADPAWQLQILVCVIQILERFDESACQLDIAGRFPPQIAKPMANDPECWCQLKSLAESFSEAHEAEYATNQD